MTEECVAFVHNVVQSRIYVRFPFTFPARADERYFVRFTHTTWPFYVMRTVRPRRSWSLTGGYRLTMCACPSPPAQAVRSLLAMGGLGPALWVEPNPLAPPFGT
jgi:hypothetical protein